MRKINIILYGVILFWLSRVDMALTLMAFLPLIVYINDDYHLNDGATLVSEAEAYLRNLKRW